MAGHGSLTISAHTVPDEAAAQDARRRAGAVEHREIVMRSLATTLVAAGALGVASLASSAPAEAQYWHRCWNCGAGVAAGVVGGTILGLGLGSALATPPYQGPGTLAPYQYGPGPYYAGPPPAAYVCHYVRMREYDEDGYPIWVRRRVCD